jgi:hypothetical protein
MQRDLLSPSLDVCDRGAAQADESPHLLLGQLGRQARTSEPPTELVVEAAHAPIFARPAGDVKITNVLSVNLTELNVCYNVKSGQFRPPRREDELVEQQTEDPGAQQAGAKSKTIELVIVYGINKPVMVAETDTIETLKNEALDALGIDRSEAGSFILRAKVQGDKDEQLDEARTVESYHLHNKQKVTLAAGTPFGSRD